MAVGEALTNIAAAYIGGSATSSCPPTGWRRPATGRGRGAVRHRASAVGMELCPALGIAIPVGKDSLSMKTSWTERGRS
jgi:phosphoribosylformylglycinamidine synthase